MAPVISIRKGRKPERKETARDFMRRISSPSKIINIEHLRPVSQKKVG